MWPAALEHAVGFDRVGDSGVKSDDRAVRIRAVRHAVRIAADDRLLEPDHDASRSVDQAQGGLVDQQHDLSTDFELELGGVLLVAQVSQRFLAL